MVLLASIRRLAPKLRMPMVRARAWHRLAAAILLGGALAAPVPDGARAQERPGTEAPVVASEAKLVSQGEVARLTVMLSRPVPVSAYEIAAPDRIVVDLPSVNFQLDAAAGRRAAGFVSAYRFGLFTQDRARMIVDLGAPATVVKAEMRSLRGGFGELVLELRRSTRQEFEAAAKAAAARQPAPAVAGPASAAREPSVRTIVIDPGHGGIDPGASVASIAEKAVVLAFGLELRRQIEAAGRHKVVMTRDDDRFVPLAERVRIAREAGADLFLSIHADSLVQAQEVRGATVYTGSERATDAEAARLAAKENQADAVAGLDSREDVQDVAGILMDLARRETRTFSSVFARNLVEKLGGSIKLHKVPLRSAGFRVLGAPDVPSVLIELGYMSSPRDAELLNSEGWRTKAVAAVKAAIESYFESQRPVAEKAAANRQ